MAIIFAASLIPLPFTRHYAPSNPIQQPPIAFTQTPYKAIQCSSMPHTKQKNSFPKHLINTFQFIIHENLVKDMCFL